MIDPAAELAAAHFLPEGGLPGWSVQEGDAWVCEQGDLSLLVHETREDGRRVWAWVASRVVDGDVVLIDDGLAFWPRQAMGAAWRAATPETEQLYLRYARTSLKVLAAETGLTTKGVYDRLRRWAEAAAAPWPVHVPRTPYDPTRARIARRLYDSGLSWREVARLVGYRNPRIAASHAARAS